MRSNIDFTPLFRTAVGFDRLTSALDQALQVNESGVSYPPYNIQKLSNDSYRIELALAGCSEKNIEIIEHHGTLTVKGKPNDLSKDDNSWVYRGIASRAFERRFQLAEHLEVKSASMSNGLLKIDLLTNIPDELKPRRINISLSKSDLNKAA